MLTNEKRKKKGVGGGGMCIKKETTSKRTYTYTYKQTHIAIPCSFVFTESVMRTSPPWTCSNPRLCNECWRVALYGKQKRV